MKMEDENKFSCDRKFIVYYKFDRMVELVEEEI